MIGRLIQRLRSKAYKQGYIVGWKTGYQVAAENSRSPGLVDPLAIFLRMNGKV